MMLNLMATGGKTQSGGLLMNKKDENFGHGSRIAATPGGKIDAEEDRATLNLSDINEVKTKAESHM